MKTELIHGDCLIEMENLIQQGIKVDAIITDPPYMYLDHRLDMKFDIKQFVGLAKKILKKDSAILYFGRGIMLYKMGVELDKQGFKFKEDLVWNKVINSSPFGNIMRNSENMSLFNLGNHKINKVRINAYKEIENTGEYHKCKQDLKRIVSDIKKIKTYKDFQEWKYKKIVSRHKHTITLTSGTKGVNTGYSICKTYANGIVLKTIITEQRENYIYEHPTQKPVKLMQKLILLTTNENQTILDPFMGSGTTGVACAKLNRNFIGIEIDKEYFKIAEKRINKETNQLKLW